MKAEYRLARVAVFNTLALNYEDAIWGDATIALTARVAEDLADLRRPRRKRRPRYRLMIRRLA